MTLIERLDAYLGKAYRAKILEKRSTDAVAGQIVSEMKADPEFAKFVSEQQARFSSVASGGSNTQCFISRAHAEFLKSALDKLNGS